LLGTPNAAHGRKREAETASRFQGGSSNLSFEEVEFAASSLAA
jgi:hypothetical protein